MSGHTPGPWPVARAAHGSNHWTVGEGPPFIAAVSKKADAHLIGAAPDIHKALLLGTRLESLLVDAAAEGHFNIDETWVAVLFDAVEAFQGARIAALEQARGAA